MRWLLLLVAACSMGKEPAPKPRPASPGTITGHVISYMSGPGANNGRPHYTESAAMQCIVRAGSAATQTDAEGAYALQLAPGHVEVSFADCATNCCYNPPSTVAAEVRAGSATLVDFSCDCDAK
jgi:hypothetical protein